MAKKLIVANWKMNLNTHQASLLLHNLDKKIEAHPNVQVVIAPSMLVLQSLSLQINHRKMKLAAQNCYFKDEGPYTGEVSATMLRGLVDYIIVGHSERRHIFNESATDIRSKVQAIIRNGMKPILCVGETAAERADNETRHVLHDQVVGGLANVTSEEIEKVVIAYEPVWAISDGKDFGRHKMPTPDDLKSVASIIRHQISSLYGHQAAESVAILYGGSSNAQNAGAYLAADGINGLLVGGASLNANELSDIISAAQAASKRIKLNVKDGSEQG